MLTKTCPPKSTISRSAYWPYIVECRGFELSPSGKVLLFNFSGFFQCTFSSYTNPISYRDHVCESVNVKGAVEGKMTVKKSETILHNVSFFFQ